MLNYDNLNKLQKQLCELKLEERRVSNDIAHMVVARKMVDFYKAKQLNSARSGLKTQIKSIEGSINPDILA